MLLIFLLSKKQQIIILLFFKFVICVKCERLGEVHTSVAQISQLVELESKIVSELSSYIHTEEKRLEAIKIYVEDWNYSTPEMYVTNPLNSYHFLRRVTTQLDNILQVLNNDEDKKVLQGIQYLRSRANIPQESDVNGAAWALVRLQSTYNLTINDLIDGLISGNPSIKGLTAEDCLRFAHQGFHNLEFDLSDKWTEKAIELLEEERPLSQTTLLKISEIKNNSLKRKMMRGLVTELALKSEKVVLEKFSGLGIPTSFQKAIHTRPEDNSQIKEVEATYLSLCRGEKIELDTYYHGLSCSFSKGSSLYRMLMPFKMEMLWPDPLLIMFHDILTDEESQILIDSAFPNLQTTQVHSFISHLPMKSLARIGKTAWVRNSDHLGIDNIMRKVSHMTGLGTETSEDFHVLNYGVGGHYDVHVDFFDILEKNLDPRQHLGDRLATVLFYLNDVKSGGSTVFPWMKLSVSPKKGSALFWFNLKRNGLGDYRTIHASCPVLFGQKWIANLWLHEFGQEFRWTCKVNPEE